MDRESLLERVNELDLGLELIINGRVNDPKKFSDAEHHRHSLMLRSRNPKKWVIYNGFACLTKKGVWVYESMPTHRTDEFKAETRFDSIEEAVEFYERWKQKVLQWIVKETNQHGPNVVLNLPDNVMELS